MTLRVSAGGFALAAASFLAVTACNGSGKSASPMPSASVLPPSAPQAAVVPVPGNAPTSFADLVAHADPGVVFVKTTHERRALPGRSIIGEALGSAFVYDPDGLILTNNHVIEGATDIQVTVGNSRVLSATVVGRDPPTDVAVLRVEAKGLPALPIGDSDASRVGDWVIAIGNPFGLSHTVSAGIISAKDRTNQDLNRSGGGLSEEGYYDFLQTDASINPGNSGGPLLDTQGRVVGINTAIRGGANNIGFAIPINMVKEVLPRLLKDGKIQRSALGVVVSPVLPDDVERLKLGAPGGALVNSVVAGGPADRAGLAIDDVILAFNGRSILRPEHLRWSASLAGVGSSATIRASRRGRQFDIKVTLGELPAPAVPSER
ncbi:MAG TPA: trypsin-like peptidase domain-containing protein [Polyangiaceae bacterium]|nr:trypsin-like peptidase domain-containing protein [Polyangiaceae bacterium]